MARLHEEPRKKVGMTSEQAGALLISDGLTDDPEIAQTIDMAHLLNIEHMVQSSLRSSMGFDFEVKYTHRKFYVRSQQHPIVATQAKYDGTFSEESVNALVAACLRLKKKYEAEQRRIERQKKMENK